MIGKSVMSEHLMAYGKPRAARSNDSPAGREGKSSEVTAGLVPAISIRTAQPASVTAERAKLLKT